MRIEIGKITKEYLEKTIELIDTEIDSLNKIEFRTYTLEYFKNLDEKEIQAIFKTYEFDNPELNSKRIANYFWAGRFSVANDEFFNLFSNNSTNESKAIEDIIEHLNRTINDKKSENDITQKQLEFEKSFYQEIYKYLYENIHLVEDDYQKIFDLITTSNLSEDEKFELSLIISRNLITRKNILVEQQDVLIIDDYEKRLEEIMEPKSTIKETEKTDSPEELQSETKKEIEGLLNITNEQLLILLEDNQITKEEYQKYINFARVIFTKYSSEKSKYGDVFNKSNYKFEKLEDLETFNIEELDSIIQDEGLTFENWVLYISSMIANIFDAKCVEIKESYQLLKYYDMRYTNYVRKKEEKIQIVNNASSEISMIVNIASSNATIKADWQEISNLTREIERIKNEIEQYVLSEKEFETIEKTIEYIVGKITEIKTEVMSSLGSVEQPVIPKQKIKAFVFFEGTNVADVSKNVPYIVMDLNENDPKNLIDKSLIGGKSASEENNHYVKIPELITDLMIYDNPKAIENSTSSVEKKKDNILDFVYKDKNRSQENRTGMHRIRPSTNSDIRFVEQKIVLNKNTDIYKQVIGLLKKYMPNIEVSEDEDFSIYVNIGAALKKGDEDLYKICNKRYSTIGSEILKLFHKDGLYTSEHRTKAIELKDSLTTEEIKKLEKIIASSIRTLDMLNEIDKRYTFGIIDNMRGGKKNGLQQ